MADLFESLQQIARSGRVGQPVFLRCHVTSPPERALTSLAEALAAATALFEETPTTLRAAGDETVGALHAILVFHSGATLLAFTGPGEQAVDVMLLGNHGGAYGPGAPGFDDARADTIRAKVASGEIDQWVARIRRSLAAGQPVRSEELGCP